ncbi:lasso peptide biosynthesis B2 protein (plasmid) [Asticcacaulis sp. DW145]|uniref:lasso peptide biosynthesis B2 protein n=1 Tax=Asticcacaulis sp. DW145 TaxID=3095608 RepID=UPI003089C493|nr:lasso peptide biosynthesis B2 protein [Asticcacaulis sp. DW145]
MTLMLRDDLSFCNSGNRLVFLDLAADRYFMLPNDLESAFRRLLVSAKNAERDIEFECRLKSAGILVDDESAGSSLKAMTERVAPTSEFSLRGKPTKLVLILSSICIQIETELMIRFRGLKPTIQMMRAERVRYGKKEPKELLDRDAVVSSFLSTRRIVPTQDRCLSWAISMARYLAKNGQHSQLIIGVNTSPFSAHAWTQQNDVVISDYIDRVRDYNPILVS